MDAESTAWTEAEEQLDAFENETGLAVNRNNTILVATEHTRRWIRLPDETPDDFYHHYWQVPLTDSLSGRLLTGTRAGEVCIRRSDGQISLTSIPSILTNADDARSLAAALLAVAEVWEQEQ